MAGRPRKLTVEQVRAIRAWYRLRKTIPNRKKMAARLGISLSTLMDVASGEAYREIRP